MSVLRGNNQQTANPKEASTGTSLASNAMPLLVMKGDVLVATANVAGGTVTSPGGWTNLIANNGSAATTKMDYLVVGDPASLSASYTWSGFTSGRCNIFITAFRGVDPFTPFDAAGSVGTNSGSGNSCVIAAITTVSANCMLVASLTGNASTGPPVWTSPGGGWVEVNHSTGTGKGSTYAADKVVAAGSTGTQTWTWDQTNLEIRGVMGALRPAPGQSIRIIDSAIYKAHNW